MNQLTQRATRERRKIDTASLRKIRPHGADLAEVIRRDNPGKNRIVLAFSCGKDAVATWIWLRDFGFDVIPLHRYVVPGLSFVEEAVAYYQDFFGTKIWSLPHSHFHRQVVHYVYQPPHRLDAIDLCDWPEFSHEDQRYELLDFLGEDESTWIANGVRAADAMNRRINILVTGPITYKTGVVLPIWDWSHDDVEASFVRTGVKLPDDYAMWGRSLDGIDWSYCESMREQKPDDYKKLIEWFPLVEADRKRYEYARNRRAKIEARRG